jgi:hypothetical protein
MMDCITLLGFGVSTSDADLRNRLPFASTDMDRGAIPALLRRRTSEATQLAFSAASRACDQAGRPPAELPAVFASVGGEIRVTDTLCIELGKPDGMISPTAFHNSVHNTAAGYWSIVHRCTRAASALAAGRETFAMALLEAWCLLDTRGGELLLVCYDERWPDYLSAPMGSPPFACALVLAAGRAAGGLAEIGRPCIESGEKVSEGFAGLISNVPAAAAIPLLMALEEGGAPRTVPISAAAPGWSVRVRRLQGSENR